MVQRKSYITRLVLSGLSYTQIVESATQSGDLNIAQVTRAYDAIIKEYRRDHENGNKHARYEAVQRLRRDLASLRNPGQLSNKNGYPVFKNVLDEAGRPIKRNGKNLKQPVMAPIDYARIVQHEALLAKIEGTLKPMELKLDVDVVSRTALFAIVAELSSEKIEQLALEQSELERRARLAPG